MSRCLRYQNAEICEHLASQYVAGMLSPRVRARIESLVKTVPELDRAIAQWSDDFSELHQHIQAPEFQTNNLESIWADIDQKTKPKTAKPRAEATHQEEKRDWFGQLFVWKVATITSAFASLLMAVMLLTANTSQPAMLDPIVKNSVPVTTGPDYLANMSNHANGSQDIQFVITAYGKNEQRPSRLHIQWLKNQTQTENKERESIESLHLWAEDRDSGELVYIGVQPEKGVQWDLNKPRWLAITNSSRLLMTRDKVVTADNIVFSGRCLQLNSWKA